MGEVPPSWATEGVPSFAAPPPDVSTVGGAALDVTDPEPLPDGHPLWTEPRALITPHSANPPQALVRGLVERVEENVGRFIGGGELVGVIDAEAGY